MDFDKNAAEAREFAAQADKRAASASSKEEKAAARKEARVWVKVAQSAERAKAFQAQFEAEQAAR